MIIQTIKVRTVIVLHFLFQIFSSFGIGYSFLFSEFYKLSFPPIFYI